MTSDAKFWRKTDSWFQKRHDKFGEFSPSYSKSKNFTLMGYFCSKYEVWATNIQTSYLSWHWTVTQNLIKPLQCGLRHLQELRFSRKLYSIHTTFQTLFPFFMSMARTKFYKVESKQTALQTIQYNLIPSFLTTEKWQELVTMNVVNLESSIK